MPPIVVFFGNDIVKMENASEDKRIGEGEMKKIDIVLLVVVGGLALLGANYALMAGLFFGPSREVRAALKSDKVVEVSFREKQSWLVFNPLQQTVNAGLVMYPEGYQDIRAYAPISRQISQQGFVVVLLSRRMKFPPTLQEEEQRVSAVMAAFPQVRTWFIGAHTWEADLAAQYANLHADKLAGVVLWAGRLSADNSLANSSLPVLYVYGTRDDENESLIARYRSFLPPQTTLVIIQGGNRVNFANFGPMPRDVGATIPFQEQQNQASSATVLFMKAFNHP